MKKLFVALAVGFLLFGTSPPSLAQGTFPLEYKIVKGISHDDPLVAATQCYLSRSPGMPAEVKGTPKDAKGEMTYYVTEVGSRQLVVAMDTVSAPDGVANVFIDRNGDGNLADEKPLKRTKATLPWNSGSEGWLYGPASVTVGKDGASVRVLIAGRGEDMMVLFAAGYLVGQVKLGEKTYKIAMIDGDYDGRIEPVKDILASTRGRAGDMLAIDLDGNGKFEYDPNRVSETQPLTPMIHVAGRYYQVKLAADGSNVEMVTAEPKMGTLAVKGSDVELMVLGESGMQLLNGPKSSWQLPAGRYTCQSISLVTTDEKKSKWMLQAARKTGELQSFEIQPEKVKSIELGSPLTIKADVQKQSTGWIFKGTEVSVGFVIVGKGGEEYSPAATKDGTQVPAPKVAIYDAEGKVLASGNFAYG